MVNYTPHYYKDFKCIADKCRDSCCIGWEIDIDPDTLDMYMSIDGEIGELLRSNITVSEDGSDCFRLTENERCPFLNENNLCKLILLGGDSMLCGICRMHPRFVNEYGSRCETGIGLCCEEAARIILTDDKPFELIGEKQETSPDPELEAFINLRQKLFDITESGGSTDNMSAELLKEGAAAENISFIIKSDNENIRFIRSLEPLNEQWQSVAARLSEAESCSYSNAHQKEYAALMKYYIFRYFLNAFHDGEIFLKTALAVFSARAVTYIMKSAGMSFIDSACLWSKEIEYSAENMEAIYDYLFSMTDDLPA